MPALTIHRPYRIILLIATSLCLCKPAWARDDISRYISFSIEAARWQEFSQSDNRLLSESGPRLSFTAGWQNLFPDNRFARFNATGRIYAGDLGYDGQTQSINTSSNGIYVSSTSHYSGFNADMEALFGLGTQSTTALLGIGTDLWRRDIDDATDAKGNNTSGFIEDYQVLYTKLGLQKEINDIYGQSRARFGIKYPLRINEQASGISPELHPGRRASLFASYRLILATQRQTIFEVYYEGLRFSRSPAVTDQYGYSWRQPRSHQDTIGITFGIPY